MWIIDGPIYLEQCLKRRLLPFINCHHRDSNFIFWPDLASAHYSGVAIEWMSENLNFVGKEINPPNVPQARPIESFWGDLANKVYSGDWEAKTCGQLVAN
jgi:hypothetical protein